MKRIRVSDQCVACGFCIVENEFFDELPNGKAKPAGTGLITEDQYISVLHFVENCPVYAISIIDDKITQSGGKTSVLALKKMINEKLRGYEIPRPSHEDFEFFEEEHMPPPVNGNLVSDYEYSTYEKAHKEGFSAFNRLIYSQRDALVQAILISYKYKNLSKFSHYIEEEGNYYYDVCKELSALLIEIETMVQYITNGEVTLPEDFAQFTAGPDYGYDGNLYCYKLRNVEQLDIWNEDVKPATYFNSYINCEKLGDYYKYNIEEVQQQFRDYVVLETSQQLTKHIFDWIDDAVQPFAKLVNKKIKEKINIVFSALKTLPQFSEYDYSIYGNVKLELTELIEGLNQQSLTKEFVAKSLDMDYNPEYRFTSESKCREAAEKRLWRFYDSCQRYFTLGYSPRISEDLSEGYQKQIETIVNTFKSDVQAIFDKYGIDYPQVEIRSHANQQIIAIDFSSFEECTSNIHWELRDLIDSKVLSNSSSVKYYDYFNYDTSNIDIVDTIEWKTGLFGGEKEYRKYRYIIDFGNIYNGFFEACKAYCQFAYEEGFLQEYFNRLKNNLTDKFRKEVIDKLPM